MGDPGLGGAKGARVVWQQRGRHGGEGKAGSGGAVARTLGPLYSMGKGRPGGREEAWYREAASRGERREGEGRGGEGMQGEESGGEGGGEGRRGDAQGGVTGNGEGWHEEVAVRGRG